MSLKFKTILGVALIEAILLTILIVTVSSYMRESAGDAIIKRAQTTSTLFATTAKDPVISYDLASLESFSHDLLANPDLVYVRVLDAKGRLFSSAGNKEVLQREFVADESLEHVSDGILDNFALIEEGGILYGRVELGIDIASVESAIAESRRLSIFIASIEMVLVACFSYLLGAYLTGHLKVLRKSTKKIAEGDYTVEIPIQSADELAEVARAFNHMTAELRESEKQRNAINAELVKMNQTLEDRVERRTKKINKQMMELREANEKVAETQQKLVQSEKLASIGQLAAGVAHEINNPIGFVRSNLNTLSDYIGVYKELNGLYSGLLDDQVDAQLRIKEIQELEKQEDMSFVAEDVDELIADSIDGTTRIRDIVQGLKNFSRVNEVGKHPCDVNECIRSTLKIVASEFKSKCHIETDLSEIPLISGHKGEISQVLMNLLVNAGHAVDNGGLIKVSTTNSETAIQIVIADNGSGISEENMSKLYDPFFTTKPVGKGTGLGLSITFGIIQDHGGEIDVQSEVGTGTTFTIELPVDHGELNKAA